MDYQQLNTYELSRNFWNWAFDNPEKIKPNHSAIYFFAIEHCNRLGGKEKFGFPSQMTMEAIGIKKHQTYIKYFNELVDYGFFKLIEKSKNQYSANIISLIRATPKKGKALDKANIKHRTKHEAKQSTYKQTSKQVNNNIPTFEDFKKYSLEKKPKVCISTLKLKYESWIENDWKNGNGKSIKNWKSTLLNTLPYIKEVDKKDTFSFK